MPAYVVKLLPEALDDLRRNERWYAARSESAASALLAEFDRAIQLIGSSPGTWPRWRRGTHRFILARFPISLVYRIEGPAVQMRGIDTAYRGDRFAGGQGELSVVRQTGATALGDAAKGISERPTEQASKHPIAHARRPLAPGRVLKSL